ncbi:MAG: OmpA family protein [Bacteroidota bacterium]
MGQTSVPRLLELAEESYNSSQFLVAIQFYEKAVKIDKENYAAKYRLGLCYNQTLQYKEAKKVFLEIGQSDSEEFRAKSLYNYANLIKADHEFEEADSIYAFLIAIENVEEELINLARKQKEGCLLAIKQQDNDLGYTITFMDDINSRFHEFGAVINPSNDHLVLNTTRNLPGVQYEGSQYEGLLPDLVSFELRKNSKWRYASNDQKFGNLNTQWAEGSGTFTKDGKSFYFSSCRGEADQDCQIMVSYLGEKSWSAPIALNEYINEPGAENKQPFITPLGDTLFFSSDRPGGMGGSDIWMSLRGLEKDSWTPAINVGEAINTPENEITPYYSSAYEALLFSSNGHVGYGGYDIYAAKGESFFEPEIYNFGSPFNSTKDDTYFMISDSIGFLSSNRLDSRVLDVYNFEVKNEALFLALLISGESLIDAKIASRLRDVKTLDLVTFRVEDYQGYELFDPVKRSKARPALLEQLEEETEARAEVAVAPTPPIRSGERFSFEQLYFDYGSYELRQEAKAALNTLADHLANRSFVKINVLAYTDQIGTKEGNLKLSKQRGIAIQNYLAAKGIPTSKMSVLARGELSAGADEHWFNRVLNRRVELVIDGLADKPELAKTYIVRKRNTMKGVAVFFDVDLAELRKWNSIQQGPMLPGNTVRIYPPFKQPKNNDFFLDRKGIEAVFKKKLAF